MSALAPTLQAFFTDRLTRQRHASPNTIAAYRDALKLLLAFAAQHTGKEPSQLDVADLDAETIAAFLDHLQHQRGNSVTTRNARLAAIRSLFRFAALRHPEHAATIERVLAIPAKRSDRTLICYLTDPEIDALLAAPDPTTWTGRRDHALLVLAVQTGLRASELTGLRCSDVQLGTGAHVACRGKGRNDRITPLTRASVAAIKPWLAERAGQPSEPLFPTRRGTAFSRDALERRLALYTTRAAASCPSILTRRTSPCTCCATPRRCACSTPASIPRSSRYGSVTRTSRPPRSTCTPTSPSKKEQSAGPLHRTPALVATSRQTRSLPSSEAL